MAQHVHRNSLDLIPDRGIKSVVAEPQRPVPPLQPFAVRQSPRKLQRLGIIQQTPPDRFRGPDQSAMGEHPPEPGDYVFSSLRGTEHPKEDGDAHLLFSWILNSMVQ